MTQAAPKTWASHAVSGITSLAARLLGVDQVVVVEPQSTKQPLWWLQRLAADQNDPVIIHDAALDPRVPTHAARLSQPAFYAAARLRTPGAIVVATAQQARLRFTPAQQAILADFAVIFSDLLQANNAPQPSVPPHATAHDLLAAALTPKTHPSSFPPQDDQTVLFLVGFDGLEPLLDTLPARQAEALLHQIVERLETTLPPTDRLAPLPGRSFAIIRAAPRNECAVIAFVRRLLRIVGAPYHTGGGKLTLPVAIGVAPALNAAIQPETLMRHARVALRRAARDGTGYRVHERGMGGRARQRQSMRLDLGAALEQDQFHLAYQPMIDLRSGRVASFEALIRWTHPHHGAVAPADFIPIAEQGGLIDDIGAWALRRACRDATVWADQIGVSVNLSPLQFRSRSLPAMVRRALDDSGLPAARLELEITESVMLPDSGANLALLRELRGMGVAIAMDDFGSGHASFAYLRSFVFDKIKIDQMFVRDMQAHPDCAAIVRAITGLARDLGVATAAEGVECHTQLEQLRSQHCDQAQGFLFSRPIPQTDISALLARFHPAAPAH